MQCSFLALVKVNTMQKQTCSGKPFAWDTWYVKEEQIQIFGPSQRKD